MQKSIRCGDLYHECKFISHGANDDEVTALALHHAQMEHGLAEVDWAVLAKFSKAICDDTAPRAGSEAREG
ncbi:MAG TPA: DUF1059 domain-containing protein [Candidatus Acidoferrales bacterium]|nr:DUF1059 domain-containing protein [Candidatus Acidoferrales bacterium]